MASGYIELYDKVRFTFNPGRIVRLIITPFALCAMSNSDFHERTLIVARCF